VDTVNQGDRARTKGVHHINAVDAVTQWQIVGCAEKISELYLPPVPEAVLAHIAIRGFHADNGSEYIQSPDGGNVAEAAVVHFPTQATR